MMDDHYIYVFIRQDLPIPLQLVHACHAVYQMTCCFRPDEGIPCLVVIGVPDSNALGRVRHKLRTNAISHHTWDDPDDQEGPLAIASVPLNRAQKNILKNYRLYSLGAPTGACGVTADEGARAAVVQLREHSVFNGEVAGENPAGGSN